MGKYSVPAEIRAMKPKGTMVKAISGRYYVYEYRTVREGGRKRTEMGRCIGSITAEGGFAPNSGTLRDEEVTCLDLGEWAVALALTRGTRSLLRGHFNPRDADRVYALALVHLVLGYTATRNVPRLAEPTALSLALPGARLGRDSVSALYDDLGRREGPVLSLERALVGSCSGEVAVDGHAVASASAENDLSEKGSKFRLTGEPQMNLLVALDVNAGTPLASRLYEGGAVDASTVRDLLDRTPFRDALFLVDRGFYSAENLGLLTANGCQYVIPLARHLRACRAAVSSLDMQGRFMYERGRKASVVEWREDRSSGARVLVFRDVNEAAAMQANYLRHMARGDRAYTQASFDEKAPHMGVTVLQTSLEDRPPEEVYRLYKKRWAVETHFDWLKNGQGFEDLGQQGYHRLQGLAFVLLVAGLAHRDLSAAVGASGVGMSVNDVLMEAKMVKACKRGGAWVAVNCKRKRMEMLSRLGVDPAEFLKPLPAT